MTSSSTSPPAREVARYWDAHPQGSQFLHDAGVRPGSQEFFDLVRPHSDIERFDYVRARIEREAALLRGKRLLEIGCGLGFDAVAFMKQGVRVVATDLTRQNIELAGRHFALEGVTPEGLQVEDAYRLSFPDDTFDGVYSCGVLGHMEDPGLAIREVFRVLKPGGRAIMTHLYRRRSLFYLLSLFGGRPVISAEGDAPPVTRFFSDADLRAIFPGFGSVTFEREHYRLIPSVRPGLPGKVYSWCVRPIYNLMPLPMAKWVANKVSVIAVKPG